jgi:hypothetical protein
MERLQENLPETGAGEKADTEPTEKRKAETAVVEKCMLDMNYNRTIR